MQWLLLKGILTEFNCTASSSWNKKYYPDSFIHSFFDPFPSNLVVCITRLLNVEQLSPPLLKRWVSAWELPPHLHRLSLPPYSPHPFFTKWWSSLTEGLLSTGPTQSSLFDAKVWQDMARISANSRYDLQQKSKHPFTLKRAIWLPRGRPQNIKLELHF